MPVWKALHFSLLSGCLMVQPKELWFLSVFTPQKVLSSLLTFTSALQTAWLRITFQLDCRAVCPIVRAFSPCLLEESKQQSRPHLGACYNPTSHQSAYKFLSRGRTVGPHWARTFSDRSQYHIPGTGLWDPLPFFQKAMSLSQHHILIAKGTFRGMLRTHGGLSTSKEERQGKNPNI